MKKILPLALSLAFLCQLAHADEGMWLVKDLKGDARDAIVAIDFFGTGSIISDQGLLITNQHVAYADIASLSTNEHNYLRDGFWAHSLEEELPIPGRRVFFLKEMIDVTDEANALRDSLTSEYGKEVTFRKLGHIMETRYKSRSGLEASFDPMWCGMKFYVSLYEAYSDVRLVAAPPESISQFGGEIDNWQWPQHKCDFTLYRVYTAPDGSPSEYSPNNVPLKPVKYLKVSRRGYKEGDKTTVIGFPGRTNRYASSMETRFEQEELLPINNSLRARQMQIMKSWMERDPEIKLKYSNEFFSLSNVAELEQGKEQCVRRFGVIAQKEASEKEFQDWINRDENRKMLWGNLLSDMQGYYDSVKQIEKTKAYFRETMFRGPIIWRTVMRSNNAHDYKKIRKILEKGWAETDPRVEKELIRFSVEEFYKNIPQEYWGDFQKSLKEQFADDYSAITDYIWDDSIFASPENAERLHGKEDILSDKLFRFQQDLKVSTLNEACHSLRRKNQFSKMKSEYTRAFYQMQEEKGVRQYPNANSTMRYTTGKVCSIEPRDGVRCDWHSNPVGIFEKYNPSSSEFCPPDDFMEMLRKGDWARWASKSRPMYIDFMTDNDITGGNSGSPVLNSKDEVIGLAFDGNVESLASDVHYTEGYNKCICVDIRYVMWVLDEYAGMQNIIDEIEIR